MLRNLRSHAAVVRSSHSFEMLNAVVDFGQKCVSIMQGDWEDIKRGKGRAMLLKLADGVECGADLNNVEFDLPRG